MARKKRATRPTKAAALADVAREAGVSLATASRVLSRSAYYVTDEMRRKVVEAAERLSYNPNTLARALAAGRSKMVGVLIGRVTDPYYAEIVEGVEDQASRAGYLTIICNTGWTTSAELTYLRWLRAYHAAGVIFAAGVTEDGRSSEVRAEATKLLHAGVRVVSVAERPLGPVPLITIDNVRAMADLTAEIVAYGHRRIGYVGGPRGFSTADLRVEGFRKAMARAGLEPALVELGDYGRKDGQQLVIRLLQAGPMPDAIICDSDEAALGLLVALGAAGISVPGDVSVAGFDNTRDADLMGLTTVAVPTLALGAAAADHVSDHAASQPPQHVVLPSRVVLRNTTRPKASAVAAPREG
jgi:LacI family transcriptional regulator